MAGLGGGRSVAWALLGGTGVLGAWLVACGLNLDGLGAIADAGGGSQDAFALDTGSETDVALPSCIATDAACLGALPTGWRPVSLTDAGCAPDFDAETLQTNARVEDGGCACGACQVVGAYTCDAGVAISGGNNCGDPTLVTTVPGACTAAQAQHVEAHSPDASGTVGCFAPNDAGGGATTDPVTVCSPSCSADFCGASSRCILADGSVPCPSGFTLFAHAGTGADPGCAPCACEAGPPGACSGTVTVFDNASCGDAGTLATYPVDTCHQFSTAIDYQSVFVDLVPPEASCSNTVAPNDGDASLLGVQTICCL